MEQDRDSSLSKMMGNSSGGGHSAPQMNMLNNQPQPSSQAVNPMAMLQQLQSIAALSALASGALGNLGGLGGSGNTHMSLSVI